MWRDAFTSLFYFMETKMENFLFRLSENSFVRFFDDYGYIVSQLTKHDYLYDKIGQVFLQHISRDPHDFLETSKKLHSLFIDVSLEEVQKDFFEFIKNLESGKFVITGKSVEELDKNDFRFSYADENPKTFALKFDNNETEKNLPSMSDVLFEEFHKQPRIFSLQFELTSCCNERCIHCYIPHEWKNETLDKETVFNVLDQAAEMGTLGLTLSGGEALLHPDFIEILRYARKKDFMVTILSNLTLLNDKIVQAIKECNVSLIQTSLYSMDAAEHDFITTVPGSFEKTKKGIERLIANDIPVQISCPVMKKNLHSYKNVMKWAYEHKIKSQTDFIMMAQSDFNTQNLNNRISVSETEELIRDIIKVDCDYQRMLDEEPKKRTPEEEEKEKLKPKCGAGTDSICIAANGNFYPCAGWQNMVVGNIKEKTLKDIWENSEQLKFIRNITNGSFPKCLKCEAKDYCAMCMVRNFNESNGDVFKVNQHFCDVAFLTKKLAEEYRNNKKKA